MVSSGFFIDLVLPVAHDPGVKSFHNMNEYQGYRMGVRRSVNEATNFTTFMCRFSRNSGSLKLLEP
jgi:hypothetical protein